jgi:hypothetical protein
MTMTYPLRGGREKSLRLSGGFGFSNGQKNRAPVPGMPGLQQSQFITGSETEIANVVYANGGPSPV